MIHKREIFVLVLSLTFCSAYSLEPARFFLAFETGLNFVSGNLNSNWKVRQDVGNYDYGYGHSNSISSEMTISSVGIKPGMSFFQNKVGVYTGLRYTQMNSTLSKNSSVDGAFFYLSDKSSTVNTEYYKVRHITEDNDYLGIPLEIIVLPFKNDYLDLYLKVGGELNFKFHTSREIEFANIAMKPYQQMLLDNAKVTPNSIYSSVYSAVGVRMGKKNRVKYDLELVLPSYILTKNNSSLVIPEFYSGIKFAVQIPIKKSAIKTAE